MRFSIAVVFVAAALTLAGCGAATPAAQPSETAAAGVKVAKGTGTVTAVDAEAGRVSLDHAPMPEIGWPAMSMTFAADPALLTGVKAGDKVAFDLTLDRGLGEITALSVQ